MPRLKWSPAALRDVACLHGFLADKDLDAAKRSVKAIREGVKPLGRHPEIGRPVEGMLPGFQERVLPFGHGASLALYHVDDREVLILAVRHGREEDF